ncbi:MAG: CBS domain-containing protein [Candidatus Micrarchaeota archaeon]|nr:CBS domain-containing protein [Candidatus Micrarchaeota archaeon]
MEIENPTILDANEPVSRAINEISRSGLPVIVTKNGKYAGIIDERSIRTHSNPSKEKCGTLAERTPTLTPNSAVLDACQAFFAGRYKAIPVISGGKIEGAITRRTLFAELLKEKLLTKKRVSEVMTSPVITLDIGASVGQARAELRQNHVRRLVVTKDGKIAGLLSVFDLATSHSSSGQMQSSPFYRGGEKTSMDSQPMASYMRTQVESISASETLVSAVKKMLDKQVAALIVSDAGYPRGIVTAKDILHAALADEKAVRVFVSGLPYEQRDYQDMLIRSGEKLLSRLSKSFEVRSLAFHVKPEGSQFSIRARLDGKKSYNASAIEYGVENAVREVLDELERMAEKDKPAGINKRKTSRLAKEE